MICPTGMIFVAIQFMEEAKRRREIMAKPYNSPQANTTAKQYHFCGAKTKRAAFRGSFCPIKLCFLSFVLYLSGRLPTAHPEDGGFRSVKTVKIYFCRLHAYSIDPPGALLMVLIRDSVPAAMMKLSIEKVPLAYLKALIISTVAYTLLVSV